jgi:short-subunit dehydrogenase
MTYRFALITGASSGIGAAFARALPRPTNQLLTGRNEARLAALGAELAGDGRQIETVAADLAGDEGRETLVARASELPIDLLVNNAGLGLFGRIVDNDARREREMIEVNVVTPLVLTRALLPGMLERAKTAGRRAGVIIVSSTAAFAPLPFLATYTATKAFDLYLAEGLASELKGEPIDVLALCPGGTRTNFFRRSGLASMNEIGLHSPARVAREGLAALGRRSVHVVGAANRSYAVISRLVPRPFIQAGARRLMQRFK